METRKLDWVGEKNDYTVDWLSNLIFLCPLKCTWRVYINYEEVLYL